MTTTAKPRKSRRLCQAPSCKSAFAPRNVAVYRVGSDGFGAKSGKLVCDDYSCRSWASGGYPVTFHAINPA